jgi:hypothetical protein
MYTKRAASGGSSGCGSNRPGHDPHFIQVLRVAPQRPHHAVEDLDITGSTGVLLRVDGVWLRLNNHRNGRVLAAWHNRGGVVGPRSSATAYRAQRRQPVLRPGARQPVQAVYPGRHRPTRSV